MGEFSGEAISYHVSVERISHSMGIFHANMNLHHEVDVLWYSKSMSGIETLCP